MRVTLVAALLALAGSPAFASDILSAAKVQGLQKIEVGGFREAYAKPGADLSRYGKVEIAPLAFGPGERRTFDDRYDGNVARITQDNRDYLARRFQETLTGRLADTRQIVTTAAPGTLLIEMTMLNARPNRTPYDMREPQMLNAYIYGVGAATISVDVRDATSGELLLALGDRRDGEPFRDNFNKAFFWGDIEHFFQVWSRSLDQIAGHPAQLAKS